MNGRALMATVAFTSAVIAQTAPDLTIGLRFVPQENTSARTADPAPPLRERPVALVVTDGRAVKERIGEGTRGDDRPYGLKTAADVAEHVRSVLARLAEGWGVRLAQEEPLRLQVEILRFWVREQNQAVGATYVGEVRLAGSLLDASDRALWRGEVGGEARRYGRARSDDNFNEVLSDALKDACASLIEMPGWRAWAARQDSKPAPPPTSQPAGPVVDPDVLLRDLLRLREQHLDVAILVGYVRQRTLSRTLEVDDLSAWRAAGIPQEVIAAALERAPASPPPP